MSKVIPVSLGFIGIGGAGIGGYFLSKSGESKNITIPTFREKYEKSLLSFDGSTDEKLWESKFTTLKSGYKNHPGLKAITTTSNDSKAKSLHKEVCKKIYDSQSNNQNYFSDFKKYCSKLIRDVVNGTWITDNSETNGGSNKWDGKLTSLKDKKNNLIHQELKDLSSKLTTGSFDAAKRKELKDWCSSKKDQLFSGEGNDVIQEIKSYCAE
ncbi:hypothetical protein MHC_01510 [Mycoplasma haemocanis str. Illinois]|uniref:Uncharacterized protein n=1 Tax=Mycoplasma haemocanis (strain Illinois) TaxID=1111676 RepID=H6N696_MYCHN|nr:hypothetical protein [Mycoplasma haemocanis]AEW45168.1 hypothetical protein MHC_01510 [Mycoplasma haemocanis str. Illinois]